MDFDLSDEQAVVADLAEGLFAAKATPERVGTALAGDRIDRELWTALADAGALALCLSEEWGGHGFDAVELALMAIAKGRHVAPVPLVPAIVAGTVLSRHGTEPVRERLAAPLAAGDLVITSALAGAGVNDGTVFGVTARRSGTTVRLDGTAPSVPWGAVADLALVPVLLDDERRVCLVELDAQGVERTPVATTAHEPQAHLDIHTDVAADAVLGGDVVGELRLRTLAANAAEVAGLAAGALTMTAAHVSTREQFGRPLASFQAVSQRAADAYVDTEVLRVTALHAAWRLAAGLDARRAISVAAFWAADAGQRVAHTCHHLHGGVGADIDYPLHRYLYSITQLATALGAASAQLHSLGKLIAEGAPR